MEVATAIEQGILALCPGADTVKLPVADGGDGTLDALVRSAGGEVFTSRVTGPLGEAVSAPWGVMRDGQTAVIEMARASGLGPGPPAAPRPQNNDHLWHRGAYMAGAGQRLPQNYRGPRGKRDQ